MPFLAAVTEEFCAMMIMNELVEEVESGGRGSSFLLI